MRLLDELRDPWGLLTAAVSGGLGWAVLAPQINDGAAAIIGAGIAVVALGIKVLTGAAINRDVLGEDELPVTQGSPEAAWLRRAELAAGSLREVAGAARPGPVADRLAGVVTEAATTLGDMRRLAGQTSAVTSAMWRVDIKRLEREEQQLVHTRESAHAPDVRSEVDRSLVAVRGQLDVHRRLFDTAAAMLARMQSGALGLESLVARIAELVALADASPGGIDRVQQIDELAADLEGLRLGLAETAELSRRVLGESPIADAAPVVRKDDSAARDRGRAGPLQGGN
ncbi:MAG: hypothetical protein ABIM89_09370 [Mycobacteriales bacterium]